MKLQDYLREKINGYELIEGFAIATDTLRCWIDEWEETYDSPKPKMTVDELADYQYGSLKYAMKNPTQRRGQAYFNYLAQIRPELAEQIRGGGLDPFHNDSAIENLLNWLKGEIA